LIAFVISFYANFPLFSIKGHLSILTFTLKTCAHMLIFSLLYRAVILCSHQKEPELVHGNEELWTFVVYAGEDHTNTQTLVAFLGLLSTLVCKMFTALLFAPYFAPTELFGLVRLPVKLVLPKSMNCSREKFTAQLDGTLCLIAYLFMKKSLRNPFNLPQACCLIFQRGMHRHLLRI
jgi:hypothetical protein